MHDDTITTEQAEQSSAAKGNAQVTHVYYEISNDLLSKPTALCDIIESEGMPSTVVFCNSPSDTDLVEVMLKKRGISARKLIGHVPPAKTVDAMKQAQRGELSVIVVTDIAARNVEVEDIDLVVNYSVPSDPEIYIHRMGRSGQGGKRHLIFSLVSPLDIGNFHYIKKFVETPFQKAELPTKESMANIKFKNLCVLAERQALNNDPSLLALVKQVTTSETKESLIAMLLHNTLNVIPSLRTSAEREQHAEEPEGEMQDERFSRDQEGGGGGHDRGGRGDRRDRGGDRGGRRGGGRDRDQRGGGGRGNYGDDNFGRQENAQPDSFEDRGGEGSDRGYDDHDDRPRGRGRDRDRGGDRGERQPYVPPQRDVRIYIGSGTRHGLSEQKFRELITANCAGQADKIKRFSQRDCYAFVDVAEEAADEVVSKLDNMDVGDAKLMLRKAISINVPREEDKTRDDMDGQPQDNGQEDIGGQEDAANENF